MRAIGDAEAIATLSPEELALPRHIERIDSRAFADDVNGGNWRSSHAHLRQATARIRALADKVGAARIKHLGIAEVPHLVALGAYLGDERLIESRDFDRDRSSWEWRTAEQTLKTKTEGLPLEKVSLPGDAVIRVEISYPVLDADVDSVVKRDRLADIRIRADGRLPAPGIVQSAIDAQIARAAMRDALAALADMRPNIDVIHLFVAAPVSVCIAIGQELRLRNGKEIQTYRYRSGTDGNALTPALLLTEREIYDAPRALSDAERALATRIRAVWSIALKDLQEHAQLLKLHAPTARWYEALNPAPLLQTIAPFPELNPIWELVNDSDRVSSENVAEFGFDKETREWKLDDHLVLGMYAAAGNDEARLRLYARLFFWHEYVHFWQGITKYTAIEIGQLANCLERADYVADAYALLHQLDFITRKIPAQEVSDERLKKVLLEQTGIAISSFWTFEPSPPMREMQERRLRRYLNWYWRRAQFIEAPDTAAAIRVLARQPCIEIAGLHRKSVGGNRINVRLQEPNGFGKLHIGIMLENGRLLRHGSSVDASLDELANAFCNHQREEIERYFNAKVDQLRGTPGAVIPID